MQMVNSGLEFLKLVVLTTVGQLLAILGAFFIFGIILYFLARFTRTTFVRSVGYKADVIWTGWLGTPVHELGHALFCILFRHRIVEMKLYDPNAEDGSLGYVNHAYNPNSTYQKIGNFFIGAGPIILGAFVLYAAMYYLVPNKDAIFKIINVGHVSVTADLASLKAQFVLLYETGEKTIEALFTPANLKTWTFWLFIYISICVASHMELSPPDLKGLWSGLATLVIALFLVNFVSMLFGFNVGRYIMMATGYTGIFIGLFIYAVIISTANFVGTFVILSLYSLVFRRRLFSPFA